MSNEIPQEALKKGVFNSTLKWEKNEKKDKISVITPLAKHKLNQLSHKQIEDHLIKEMKQVILTKNRK